MIRWRDVQGYEVVATKDAHVVARVDTLVIDPRSHSVRGFGLAHDERIAPWDALAPLSGDVATIADESGLVDPDGDLEGRDPRGSLVLSDDGDALGELDDLEIDEHSGEVTTLIVGEQRIEGTRLRGLGSFAVVVDSDADPQPTRPSRSSRRTSDLEHRSRDELYTMARDQGIRGRSKMTKSQLVAALQRDAPA